MNRTSLGSDTAFIYKQWDKHFFQSKLDKGSICMMPKPPGGNQLPSYIDYLVYKEVNILVSLLQIDEINRYSLVDTGILCEESGIEFINFPIKDHSEPQFFLPFNQLIERLTAGLNKDKNIAIHCYAGIGRTGLTASSILIKNGLDVDSALIKLSQTRGMKVPETIQQISWLHHYSEQLSGL